MKKNKTTHKKRYSECGYAPFHRDKLCSLKHLKSLFTFTEKSVQVPDKTGQDVLADC